MQMQTASEAVSFSQEIEEKAAKFYEGLATIFPEQADFFNNMAKENRKFSKQLHRTYISVITDAIEGSYAINLDSDNFQFSNDTSEVNNLSDAIQKAKDIEHSIIKYYELAAEQSRALMADVPREMSIIVKKRKKNRLPKLEDLS